MSITTRPSLDLKPKEKHACDPGWKSRPRATSLLLPFFDTLVLKKGKQQVHCLQKVYYWQPWDARQGKCKDLRENPQYGGMCNLEAGDVVVGDNSLESFHDAVLLNRRGVKLVFPDPTRESAAARFIG